jgi:archaellum component FlaC
VSNYDFDYETIMDRVYMLEQEIERLKDEQIETDNTLYEIMNRLDKLEQMDYTLKNFTLGDA